MKKFLRYALLLFICLTFFQPQMHALTPGQKLCKAICSLICFELVMLGGSFYLSPSNWITDKIDCSQSGENFNFSCDIIYPYLNTLRFLYFIGTVGGSIKFGSDFCFLDSTKKRRNIFDPHNLV